MQTWLASCLIGPYTLSFGLFVWWALINAASIYYSMLSYNKWWLHFFPLLFRSLRCPFVSEVIIFSPFFPLLVDRYICCTVSYRIFQLKNFELWSHILQIQCLEFPVTWGFWVVSRPHWCLWWSLHLFFGPLETMELNVHLLMLIWVVFEVDA